MTLDQAIAVLLSGGTLPRPKSWPTEAYRGFGKLKEWQPMQANMQQACWESIASGEEFENNETVASAIASNDPKKIRDVRKAIATRYAEIWLEDMAEQERDSTGDSEFDHLRREFIATETRAINAMLQGRAL